MVQIELLYFDDCPAWRTAWNELGEVLAEAGIDAAVRLRNIDQLAERARKGFAGSPTIRIEGRDLEDYDGPPLMACRRYLDNDGRGWPSRQLLRQRLEEATGSSTPTDRSRPDPPGPDAQAPRHTKPR